MKQIICVFLACCFWYSSCFGGMIIQKHSSESSGSTDFTDDANCVAAYFFNDTGNETDDSGNSETLTQTSGTIARTSTVPTDYSGYSRDFELSETEYFSAASDGGFDISGTDQAMTISVWIKLESSAADGSFVSKYNTSSSGRSYNFRYDSSDDCIRFTISSDGDDYNVAYGATNATTLSTGWHMHTAVYNDTDIRIYLDGVLDSNSTDNPKTYSSGINSSATTVTIGAYGPIVANYLDGMMDELIVFDRALSATEVLALYDDGISGDNGGSD